jgi:nitrogenase subunit NifH
MQAVVYGSVIAADAIHNPITDLAEYGDAKLAGVIGSPTDLQTDSRGLEELPRRFKGL